MPTSLFTIRELDYPRDAGALRNMLTEHDVIRLHLIQRAVDAGDADVLVAEWDGSVVALAVTHLALRQDMGWEPGGETERFLAGGGAYLENLEVRADLRCHGIGQALLRVVEVVARQRGKTALWLHTGEWNARAHRFYAREGWGHVTTVYPAWCGGKPTRIYRKDL